jgi:hypothetical protein
VPILAAHVIWKLRDRPRRELLEAIGMVAAAAAIPIAILLAYHQACFGSPFRTGYDASATFAHFHQQGFLGLDGFRWRAFVGSTVAPSNGLFTLAPWCLLAIPGAVLLAKRREYAVTITCAAIIVMYIAFVSSLAMWRAGWSVGPRYITVMLPFLLPFVAVVLQEWRAKWWLFGLAAGTILVGIVVYSVSSATFPPWPDEFIYQRQMIPVSNPLFEISFRVLGDGLAAPNVLTGVFGGPPVVGIIPYLLIVFGLAGWTIAKPAGWRALALAVGVAVAILLAYSQLPATPNVDALHQRIVAIMRLG